jgi:hypothetical protein
LVLGKLGRQEKRKEERIYDSNNNNFLEIIAD